MNRFGFAFVFCFIILSITGPGCSERQDHGPKSVKREMIAGIRTGIVVPSDVEVTYETAGTVSAESTSMISSRVMGTVTAVTVAEGDWVKRGQLLIVIDGRDMAQKLEAARQGHREALKGLESARAQRALADATAGRYRKLFETQALSGQELDQILTRQKVAELEFQRMEAAVGRAEANLREAEVFMEYTNIRAPADGIVTDRRIDPGSMAVPGMPLLTVEDRSSLLVHASVDEQYAGRITEGMPAEIAFGSPEKKIAGMVTEVVPAVDPASRTFTVKIRVRSGDLISGLYGKVSFVVDSRKALLVPEGAIVRRGQLTGLYTVDDQSVVTLRIVKTGKSSGGMTEVISGLDPDERIIVDGVERAVDGGIMEERGE